MKSLFFEFDYFLSEQKLSEIWGDKDTLFIVDTNVLLNLYSYQDATRKAIYKSLDKVNDRLWVPHQVMLEFHKNRPEIIYKSKKNFDSIVGHLDSFIQAHNYNDKELITFDTNFGKIYPELRDLFNKFKESSQILIGELIAKLEEDAKTIKNKTEELKKQTISLTGSDNIYQKLLEFYTDEKVGVSFDQDTLNKIYDEGESRYSKEIPPGYKDSHKTEEYSNRGLLYKSKFGDLILYKQILKFSLEKKVKNVIFISEDSKKDWKEGVPHEKNKYYGVRREIREEAYKEAGILNFLIFNAEEFIKYSKIKLDNNLVADLNAVHENYLNISKVAEPPIIGVSSELSNNINTLTEEISNLENRISVFISQIEQLKSEEKHTSLLLESIEVEIKDFDKKLIENYENYDASEFQRQKSILDRLYTFKNTTYEKLQNIKFKKIRLSKKVSSSRMKLDKLLEKNMELRKFSIIDPRVIENTKKTFDFSKDIGNFEDNQDNLKNLNFFANPNFCNKKQSIYDDIENKIDTDETKDNINYILKIINSLGDGQQKNNLDEDFD
ncbi:TPA: hypothetical protein U9I78_001984 [Acinetobacter baumannii]|nr:PIN-like domain-containing protein [Acinetobacter baumannii]HEN9519373.1 hypothetical protein [Acinetobacter baumannii]